MMTFELSHPRDKVGLLRRIPVFASCSDAQLNLIADRTRLVEYKKGECVYREGDAADAFHIVLSGRLRVFTHQDGHEKLLTILHNGDSFGEISLLTGETHSATVQALNDTLVLRLGKEDFDEVINRIPSLVLYLSRLLSKRLRKREQAAGEFAEATIAAIYGAAKGVGRTCFAVALAASLKRETRREVVIMDLASLVSESSRRWLYGTGHPQPTLRVPPGEMVSDEQLEADLFKHPLDFRVLPVGVLLAQKGGEQTIAPFLSSLTGRFSYILVDLPAEVNPTIFKALTQSDLIYLVTDEEPEHVTHTKALIQQIHSAVGTVEQPIKVVLNARQSSPERPSGFFSVLQAPQAPVRAQEVAHSIGQPVDLILPYVDRLAKPITTEAFGALLEQRDLPYAVAIRRAARELGGTLVGLALGSGAALGLAHIGILKVIEREKIPIDLVAGTSIGALVGGLWASGRSAEELERMALRFKNPWSIRQLFLFDLGIPVFSVIAGGLAGTLVGWLAGPWTGMLFGLIVCVSIGLVLGPLSGGPIQGAQLMARLEADFAGKTFEETWLPFKVVAANPLAREEVLFDSGSLAEAVRASVSIPGIFKPVVRQGRLCLDGGVVNPVPVSVLKRFGAHRVIAVNVFPTTPDLLLHQQEAARRRAEQEAQLASRSFPVRLLARLREELVRSISPLIFDIIMRSMQAMEHQIAEIACREADLTLRPTVPGSHWLEFFEPEKFIRRGEEVALQRLPELKRLTQAQEPSVDNPPPGQ